jgi:hypothetical protein
MLPKHTGITIGFAAKHGFATGGETFLDPHMRPVFIGYFVGKPFMRKFMIQVGQIIQLPHFAEGKPARLITIGNYGLVFHARVRYPGYAYFFLDP